MSAYERHRELSGKILSLIIRARLSPAEAAVLLETIVTGTVYAHYRSNIQVGIETLDLMTEKVVSRLREIETRKLNR